MRKTAYLVQEQTRLETVREPGAVHGKLFRALLRAYLKEK